MGIIKFIAAHHRQRVRTVQILLGYALGTAVL